MFWRVTSLAQSPVEAILDRGDFTLADLLDEDDAIQEARALNGRLVSFLAKRETVRQLVDYIVEPPPADADRKIRFKYPFASCEILCCEIDSVFSVLLGEGDNTAEEEEEEGEKKEEASSSTSTATAAAAASEAAAAASGTDASPSSSSLPSSSTSFKERAGEEKEREDDESAAAALAAAAAKRSSPSPSPPPAKGEKEEAAAAASEEPSSSSSGGGGGEEEEGGATKGAKAAAQGDDDAATSSSSYVDKSAAAATTSEEAGASSSSEASAGTAAAAAAPTIAAEASAATMTAAAAEQTPKSPTTATAKNETNLLARLFAVLDAPRPLECARAGYFARVVARLLARRTAAVMAFLRARPEALTALVNHVDTASVAEVVARLMGADDAMGLPARELAWLRESGVLRALLEQLNPTSPGVSSSSPVSSSSAASSSSASLVADAQRHAAAVLAAVVRAHGSPLLSAFAERGFVDALLARAFAKGAPSVQALEVAVALLEPKEPPADPYLLSPAAAAAAAEIDIATKDAAVAGVVARLDDLVALLDAPPATARVSEAGGGGGGEGAASAAAAAPPALPAEALSPSSSSSLSSSSNIQLTPYGVLNPPLGLTRIKAVALLVALLRSGRVDAVAGVVASGAVSKCLDLFIAYPFNNLLHHHVAALLLTALDGIGHEEEEEEEEESEEEGEEEKKKKAAGESGDGDGDGDDDNEKEAKEAKEKPAPTAPAALLAHVLRDVNLPKWLASAPAEVRPIPLPGDTRAASGKRQPLRAGYLGHVTHLGNRLLALSASGNAAIADALASEPSWQPWADGDLAQRTQRDDPDGWECGRPAPPSFGGGLVGADSLGSEGDAYDGWGAPVNNQRGAAGGGIGGLVGASAGDSSDDDESGDDDSDGDDNDDDDDEDDDDELISARGSIRVPRRGLGRGGGAGGGGGSGSGGGGAGALDLQELAEAAASVGALRISGGDIAAVAAAAAAENGSPTLSSSSSDEGDDGDGDEDDEGLSDSPSSPSSDSASSSDEAAAVLAAATSASSPAPPAALAPAPDAAPASISASSAPSSSDAAAGWAAFPEIEGGEKNDRRREEEEEGQQGRKVAVEKPPVPLLGG